LPGRISGGSGNGEWGRRRVCGRGHGHKEGGMGINSELEVEREYISLSPLRKHFFFPLRVYQALNMEKHGMRVVKPVLRCRVAT
jgi:hypothetical protein